MTSPPITPLPPTEAEAVLRLRGIFDQLPAAVAVVMGTDHRFAFANSAYRDLVGGRELEGLPVAEALPEVVEQGFLDLLDSVLQSGERVIGREVQAVLQTDEGPRDLFVDFIYQPFRGAGGKIDGILVHAVDVSEGVTARRQLADALRREQENRFKIAIDSLLDGVIIADPVRDDTGRIVDFVATFANAANPEVGRRNADDLIGRRFTELWPGLPESGLLDGYARVVETGEPLVLDDYGYDDRIDDEIVAGVFDIRATRLGDELFLAFRDVSERIQRERALAESRARLAREHDVVTSLQTALLPREIPDVEGADIAAEYVAASEMLEVGGDWFDVFELMDAKVAIAIGDVAGKGLQAAQVMAQVRTAGRVAALGGAGPHEVLEAQNTLMQAVGLGPFATSIFAIYDATTGELTWSSAGHPPPLVLGDGSARYLDAEPGPPLGVSPAPGYPVHQSVLEPGTRAIFFTDGLVERRDEPLADGLERLRATASRAGTSAESCRSLLDSLGVSAARADDVCVLALTRP